MARVILSPIATAVRGTAGNAQFSKRDGRTILGQPPDMSDHEPTPAQEAVQDRFREAAKYGKMVTADPALSSLYEAKALRDEESIFSVARKDYLRRPRITEIDLAEFKGEPGGYIIVKAYDDVEVTGVDVTVMEVGGTMIEEGPAVADPLGKWVYTATQPVPAGTSVRVVVTARDLPGGRRTEEAEIVL